MPSCVILALVSKIFILMAQNMVEAPNIVRPKLGCLSAVAICVEGGNMKALFLIILVELVQ